MAKRNGVTVAEYDTQPFDDDKLVILHEGMTADEMATLLLAAFGPVAVEAAALVLQKEKARMMRRSGGI